MAGFNRKSPGSRSESRESLEMTNQSELLAFISQFKQQMRKLQDYLEQLEGEIIKLEKETMASPSGLDASRRRQDKWWKEQWQAKEKQLISKQDDRLFEMRKHYEQQLKNSTEILQKNNTELQNLLRESTDIASQREEEIEALKKKLRECERQLQEKINSSLKDLRDADRYSYNKEQLVKTKQALEEKRRELERIKERHASFSERRVRSDQRRTENTLSTNRQSQLESDYVIEFKDGTRVDAIDIITTRVGRYRGSKISSIEYLKCCRLACFIFEIAYEVVVAVKESFAAFTCTVMEMLVDEAPRIGSDDKAFQNKIWKLQYSHPTKTQHTTTQDALSEVMILVKERAKTYNLNFLVQHVKSSVASQWNSRYRDQLLLDYNGILLHGLDDYIKYCTQFAWCAVTQVPPLKIDYTTTAYSSRSHTVSQAFSFTEERSPTRRPVRSESRTVLCYLWPTLQDYDGKVIRKGEVILNQ